MIQKFGLVFTLFFLGACGDGDALMQGVSLNVGRADTLHLSDALGAAGASFLGRSAPRAALGPTAQARPLDGFSVRGTEFTTQRNIAVSLTRRQDWALRPNTAFTTTMGIGFEDGRYALPGGIGVFADPASVGIRSVGAVVQAGVSQQVVRNDTVAASISLSRGIDLAHNRISVQSALLDVRAQSNDITQFTALEVNLSSPRVRVAKYRPSLNLSARKYDGQGYSVLGRLVIPLGPDSQ